MKPYIYNKRDVTMASYLHIENAMQKRNNINLVWFDEGRMAGTCWRFHDDRTPVVLTEQDSALIVAAYLSLKDHSQKVQFLQLIEHSREAFLSLWDCITKYAQAD